MLVMSINVIAQVSRSVHISFCTNQIYLQYISKTVPSNKMAKCRKRSHTVAVYCFALKRTVEGAFLQASLALSIEFRY
jgi:hypothetical protein